MFDLSDPMVQEYIIEAKEHLASFEEGVLSLSKNVDEEVINALFRDIHTVKGGSGFFGFTRIGELSHSIESVMDKMRDGKLSVSPSLIDDLLEGNDQLKSLFDHISGSNDVDISDYVSRISIWLNVDSETKGLASLARVYKDLLKEESAKGRYLYYVSFASKKDYMSGRLEMDSLGQNYDIDDEYKEVPLSLMVASVLEPEFFLSTFNVKHASLFHIKEVEEKKQPPKVTEASKENKQKDPDSNSTIRINLKLLDELMRQAGELVVIRNQFMVNYDKNDAQMRAFALSLDTVTSTLQDSVMKTRMQPVGKVFNRFTRVVRDLGNQLDKEINLETYGDEVELDKTIIEALGDPLTHLIRNSCDHGLENAEERIEQGKEASGKLVLKACHEAGCVHISIEDDGRGVDVEKVSRLALEKGLVSEEELAKLSQQDLVMLITRPGFSTADEVSSISGRGVGMDVVKSCIEKLGGQLSIKSEAGLGSKILLELPLTLAIVPAMLIEQGKQRYAVPQVNVEELLCLYKDEGNRIEHANGQESYRLRDELLPIVRLEETFNAKHSFTALEKAQTIEKYHSSDSETPEKLMIIVLKTANRRYGLVVDKILSSEEIVVNPLHSRLQNLPCVTAATVMGDGQVALILDAEGIANYNNITFIQHRKEKDPLVDKVIDQSLEVFRFEYQGCLLAIKVSEMRRIVRVQREDFQYIDSECFVTVDESSIQVYDPASYLAIDSPSKTENLYLILARNSEKACGLLADKLLETYTVTDFSERQSSVYISGRFLLNSKINLLLDLESIIQKKHHLGDCIESKNLSEMETVTCL